MPPSLHEAQAAFAACLAGDDRPDLVALLGGEASGATRRLQIHRRHFRLSLAAALAGTYATVASLVGDACFVRLAQDFIAGTPPVDPVLTRYGETFARFIEARTAEHALPYLADVARLDWALNTAYHAPDTHRLSASDLAALPAAELPLMRLRLTQGSAVVASSYPLEAIWQAVQPGAADAAVELGAARSCLLVFRRRHDAAFAAISAGEASLANAFAGGRTIADALSVAAQHDPVFDLSATFARLLQLGVLARA